MVNFNKSMSEVEEKKPYVAPKPGGYIMRCLKCEVKPNAKKEDMFCLEFDIDQGPHAGNFKNFPLKHFASVNEKGLPFIKAMLAAFQLSNQNMLTKEDISSYYFDESRLTNLVVGANLRNEEWFNPKNGKKGFNLRIAHFCSTDSVYNGQVKPLADRFLDDKDLVGSPRNPSQPVQPQQQMCDTGYNNDDEIPF